MAKVLTLTNLILAVAALSTVNADPCSSVTGSGTTFIANPSSCQIWIACANGKTVNSGKCPDGKFFDNKSSGCLPSSEVTCAAADVCKGVSNGKYVANPADCHSYFYCRDNIGFQGFCKPDWIYDAIAVLCIHKPGYKCPDIGTGAGGGTGPSENPCLNVPNGIFVPNSQSCSEYIVCQNGKGSPGECKNDLFFNPETQACDFAENVECKVDGGGGISVVPKVEDICKIVVGDPPKFAADPGSCEGYYYCPDGATSKTMSHGVCPNKLYFDSAKGVCGKPEDVTCVLTPCVGKPIGYFDIFPGSCTKFNFCDKSGAKEGSCPDGYYFDKDNQNCNSPSAVDCTEDDGNNGRSRQL